jgi:hypothetical protein
MIDESTLPHRGEEIDGYRASVSTGLRPRLFRFLLHDTNLRTAYIALFIATPIGLILIWIGSKFFRNRMVVLDANDELIETRNYMVAGEMRAADQKLHASAQLKEANG